MPLKEKLRGQIPSSANLCKSENQSAALHRHHHYDHRYYGLTVRVPNCFMFFSFLFFCFFFFCCKKMERENFVGSCEENLGLGSLGEKGKTLTIRCHTLALSNLPAFQLSSFSMPLQKI